MESDDDEYTTNMIDDIVTAGQIVIDQLVANHFSSIASQLLQPFANTKLRDVLSSKNTTACPACTNVCVTFEEILTPVTHTEDPLNGERMLFECLEPGSKDPSLLPTGLSNFSKLPSGCDMMEADALHKSGGGMKDMLDISNNTVMKLIQNALDSYVRGKDDQGNLKINDLMKKLMTSENGTALDVSLNGLAVFENSTTPFMNGLPTSLYLDTLKLQNLDTFTAFDPLGMISNHTMQIRVSLSEVNVTLGLRVVVNGNQVNNMTVSTSLQGLDIEVALLLAAQTSKVDALMLGGLLHNATDCLGQVLVGAEFTAMDINITKLGVPVVVSTGSSPGSTCLSLSFSISLSLYLSPKHKQQAQTTSNTNNKTQTTSKSNRQSRHHTNTTSTAERNSTTSRQRATSTCSKFRLQIARTTLQRQGGEYFDLESRAR